MVGAAVEIQVEPVVEWGEVEGKGVGPLPLDEKQQQSLIPQKGPERARLLAEKKGWGWAN